MSVDEEDIRKATGRVNASLECWWCTNSPIYHADRFHSNRSLPKNMDPEIEERIKQSINEYDQINSSMGGIRISQGSKYGRGQKFSTTTRSIFVERRDWLSQ